jgi:hypothetical protein
MSETDPAATSPAHVEAVVTAVPAEAFAEPGESVEVFNFRFAADMVPGWILTRAREVDTGRGVRLIQANARAREAGAVARLEILEAADPAAGRTLFMETLARFQREPATILRTPPQIGEAEARLGQTCFAFLRGNLVVTVTAIGPAPLPVEDLARAFDGWLRNKPDGPEDGTEGAQRTRSTGAVPPMVKVFGRSGQRGAGAGERFAIAPDGHARRLPGGGN